LVATGIFLILTSTVLVAINPLKMFVDSRNNKRIRELKVVRDSLVQYTTDNTSGTTNILGVSIPPCTESPGTEIGTGAGKVDLSNLSGFIPTYLSSIPIDPKIGTAASTGYRVCRKSDLDYCVTAMYPESAGSSTVTMGCDYSIITPSPTPPGTPTSTPTPTSAPVTSGLVLSHQMSAGIGTTSLDETTNANNGTLTNGPTWTTGYLGSGISFDGTNDYVSVPSSTSLDMTNKVTVSAWIYPTNFADYRTMMIRINGGATEYYGMSLNVSGALICQFTPGSLTSSSLMTLNAWNHVACTYDGATISAYINGQSVGSSSASGNIGSPTTLGIGYDPVNGRYFAGKMDDVRIYNRALSPTEIAQIKAPAPTPTITLTPTPTPPSTNIALGIIPTGSGTVVGGAYATDGNATNGTGTWGASNTAYIDTMATPWMQIDLGSVKTITSVGISVGPSQPGFSCNIFQISNSNVQITGGASTYDSPAFGTGSFTANTVYTLSIPSNTTGRYVKFQYNASYYCASYTELQVYGYPPATPTSTPTPTPTLTNTPTPTVTPGKPVQGP
jgi:hypothetical protein